MERDVKSTADYMSERERQDLRDAGRGHLVDGPPGGSLADRADAERQHEREEGWRIIGDEIGEAIERSEPQEPSSDR